MSVKTPYKTVTNMYLQLICFVFSHIWIIEIDYEMSIKNVNPHNSLKFHTVPWQTPERQTPERQTPERQTPDETNSWRDKLLKLWNFSLNEIW